MGTYVATLSWHGKLTNQRFYVLATKIVPQLGFPAIQALGVCTFVDQVSGTPQPSGDLRVDPSLSLPDHARIQPYSSPLPAEPQRKSQHDHPPRSSTAKNPDQPPQNSRQQPTTPPPSHPRQHIADMPVHEQEAKYAAISAQYGAPAYRSGQDLSTATCFKCQQLGHLAARCPVPRATRQRLPDNSHPHTAAMPCLEGSLAQCAVIEAHVAGVGTVDASPPMADGLGPGSSAAIYEPAEPIAKNSQHLQATPEALGASAIPPVQPDVFYQERYELDVPRSYNSGDLVAKEGVGCEVSAMPHCLSPVSLDRWQHPQLLRLAFRPQPTKGRLV
ncbi:hypothetical protein HPB49_004813 [Dermacentor silvarum]|uniref:Uncharacterized protein n=1 Tax=Dermacentor silvarum TaxID=543639 RepID=A0ACB8DVS3_DERSI|nr:hypothetical protein HPB49_004813 [Dermacentor silvarum]